MISIGEMQIKSSHPIQAFVLLVFLCYLSFLGCQKRGLYNLDLEFEDAALRYNITKLTIWTMKSPGSSCTTLILEAFDPTNLNHYSQLVLELPLTEPPPLSGVPVGEVLFFAEGRDENNARIALGCSEVIVKAGTVNHIKLDLNWTCHPSVEIPFNKNDDDCDGMVDECESSTDCDDANDCTLDVCSNNQCSSLNANEGSPCDDRDPCTLSDTCQSGLCVGTEQTCSTEVICHQSVCDPLSGECIEQVAPDNTPCNDQLVCTSSDVCQQGVCSGTVRYCDDDNDCTLDTCTPGVGCENIMQFEPCCENGHFLPSDTICAEWSQDRCTGDYCGADIERQLYRQYCDGQSIDCTGQVQIDDWTPIVFCRDEDQLCVLEGTEAHCETCDDLCDVDQCIHVSAMQKIIIEDIAIGHAVTISGDTVLLGAHKANAENGQVYVYRRDTQTSVWKQEVILTVDVNYGSFGYSVAIRGDYAIVGAPYANTHGMAFIFHRTAPGVWEEQARLSPPEPHEAIETFGVSVAIDGQNSLVGNRRTEEAFVYRRLDAQWSLTATLIATDVQDGDHFGSTVAIDTPYAVVGAPRHQSVGEWSGAAYTFFYNGTDWQNQATLAGTGIDSYSEFGGAVALDGTTAAIGCQSCSSTGSVFVFKCDGETWDEKSIFSPAYASAVDRFGGSVSIRNDDIVAGAPTNDTQAQDAGAAYLFRQTQLDVWEQERKIIDNEGRANDNLGRRVSIDASYIVVGAFFEDTESRGFALIIPR